MLRPRRIDNHIYFEKRTLYDTLGRKLWTNYRVIYPFPGGIQRDDTVFFKKEKTP